MTEADWDRCTDPQAMQEFLHDSGRASDRKLRLFAAACCRRIWHMLTDERSRRAVEVAERYAEGGEHAEDLRVASLAAEEAAVAAWEATPRIGSGAAGVWIAAHAATAPCRAGDEDAARAARDTAHFASQAPDGDRPGGPHHYPRNVAERVAQTAVLRCLFGNPFRPPASLDSSLLTPEVLALAQRAYEDRQLPEGTLNPSLLADLASALEAAGCTDAELLAHLRGGQHWRGCHGVDLILSRG